MARQQRPLQPISIHPPRVGRDLDHVQHFKTTRRISIHPPRVGRDSHVRPPFSLDMVFQSTLPVWGGTPCDGLDRHPGQVFQSTLPVWGGTPFS